MTTRFSRYCDGLMEATWLAAVLVVPVFFNVFSARIFEPDKIAVLRSLALLCLGAWLVKILEQGKVRWDLWQKGSGWFKTISQIPLIVPVLGVGLVYIIATIFSVNPSVSFWGSYQRLQGTYTTFSYLIIFFCLICNLRSRSQIERLITTVIVTSLPVGLYGVLQRNQLDPIPWGGDVTRRIASSMGNSIFVAAYLIMVFPVTISRIVEAFRSILRENNNSIIQVARGSLYVFIAAIQVVAIYMSGSRGPALGWLGGLFFFILLMTVFTRRRWTTIVVVVSSLALASFLLVFNLEGGPLESLRSSPAIGRFGLLLNAESNSALVRRYIWEGAVELVSPHQALEFPDGRKDMFNTIRPLVGYGPESMFVAYSPFYIPELALVERRNATPDRSHNETWDAMVVSGILGLTAIYLLFLSIFFHGFKWLGLISDRRSKMIFIAFCASGGLIGALILGSWRGIEYLGLGLPLGFFLGLLAFTTYESIFGRFTESIQYDLDSFGFILLAALMSAILSHFIEINFGIAISVTRLYFWVFTSVLLLIGYILPLKGEYRFVQNQPAHPPDTNGAVEKQKKPTDWGVSRKRKKSEQSINKISQVNNSESIPWQRESVGLGILTGILLATSGFGLISNPSGAGSFTNLIARSMTIIGDNARSAGILFLFSITWIVSALLFTIEMSRSNWISKIKTPSSEFFPYGKLVLVILGSSLLTGIIFWFWHASGLIAIIHNNAETIEQLLAQIVRYENIPARYFAFLALALFIAGWFLRPGRVDSPVAITWRGAAAGVATILILLFAVSYSNLRIIQADIVFKLADPFMRPDQWPVAIKIYDQANRLAPNEDYYFLFKGKAYLEYARSLADPLERENLFQEARQELLKAQRLNPLNTDHTANLARLYSLWASYSDDPDRQRQRAEESERYFARAVVMSPNNARIWDERALVNFQLLERPAEALQYLARAATIDPSFDLTYALYADYYQKLAALVDSPAEKKDAAEQSINFYQMAIERATDGRTRFNYLIGLAGLFYQSGNVEKSIQTYKQALDIVPAEVDGWIIQKQLAELMLETNLLDEAIYYANLAKANAPDDQRDALQALIDKISQKR